MNVHCMFVCSDDVLILSDSDADEHENGLVSDDGEFEAAAANESLVDDVVKLVNRMEVFISILLYSS